MFMIVAPLCTLATPDCEANGLRAWGLGQFHNHLSRGRLRVRVGS